MNQDTKTFLSIEDIKSLITALIQEEPEGKYIGHGYPEALNLAISKLDEIARA